MLSITSAVRESVSKAEMLRLGFFKATCLHRLITFFFPSRPKMLWKAAIATILLIFGCVLRSLNQFEHNLNSFLLFRVQVFEFNPVVPGLNATR